MMNLAYTKDQLTFPAFHVWYKYKAASQQLLDSWKEKRMTGFRLSWRTENPTLIWTTTVGEIGRSIQTPGHGDIVVQPEVSDQIYKAMLPISDNFQRKMGDQTLVIELVVNMGKHDEVVFSPRKSYKLYSDGKKTWTEAEAHCKSEGAQLASIHSEVEQALAETEAAGR